MKIGPVTVNYRVRFNENQATDAAAITLAMTNEMQKLNDTYELTQRKLKTLSQRWGFIHLSIDEIEKQIRHRDGVEKYEETKGDTRLHKHELAAEEALDQFIKTSIL